MMRPDRRTGLRLLAGISVLGLCGAVLGAHEAGAASVSTILSTSCGFTTIPESPINATVSAELPDTVNVGEAAAINAFSVTITLDEWTLTQLKGVGATSVGASLTAAMTATWEQEPHDIAIPALTAPDTAIPASGDLNLVATADVPPTELPVAGDVTIAVPQLITTLTVHSAAAPEDVPCTEDPGQDGAIGTISVLDGSGTTTTTEPTDPTDPTQPPDDNPGPGDIGDFDQICKPDDPGNIPAGQAWYQIDGPLHLLKLKSNLNIPLSDLVGNAYLNFTGTDGGHACIDGTVKVPDAPGYFVMFGFAPVTAVAHTVPGSKSRTKISTGYLISRTEASIRLSDVKVNGVPLDVGPNCHTTKPAVIRLAGPFQSFTSSGKVPGIVDLPRFTGCAHGSDLINPVFNGEVAGDGNPIVANITYKCLFLTCDGVPLP